MSVKFLTCFKHISNFQHVKSLNTTQEDVEMMTATIKEFLFRAAMMVLTYIFVIINVSYLSFFVTSVMLQTLTNCFKIVEGPYNLQVGKEDEDGEGDGRVGFL